MGLPGREGDLNLRRRMGSLPKRYDNDQWDVALRKERIVIGKEIIYVMRRKLTDSFILILG